MKPRQAKLRSVGVLGLLVLSATALALAPLALPSAYSWLAQGTSEAAAQGLENAWIARLGFLLFGFAVIWLKSLARERWGEWGSGLLGSQKGYLPCGSHPTVTRLPRSRTTKPLDSA